MNDIYGNKILFRPNETNGFTIVSIPPPGWPSCLTIWGYVRRIGSRRWEAWRPDQQHAAIKGPSRLAATRKLLGLE